MNLENLASALLREVAGARHGFSPFASPPPAFSSSFWRPKQVHGARVIYAQHSLHDVTLPDGNTEADAALSTPGRPAIGVVTADCVPVLLAAGKAEAVAAVHAGWRGQVAGVLEAAVAALREAAPDARIVAAIGPAADRCCYEVGPEVLEALAPAPELVTPTRPGHARIALRALAKRRLEAAGLAPCDIETLGPCTICSESWPSYRRQGQAAGRALAYIAPAAPA